MPSPQELKHGLNLTPGAQLHGGFIVHTAPQVSMQEKTAHELYRFPVEVLLQPGHTAHLSRQVFHSAQEAMETAVKNMGILYSSYGSPYQVKVEHLEASEGGESEDERLICVRGVCVARRRRDIPTLAKQQEQHERESSGGETSEDEEEQALKGYRVVKAHFKSSHCPACGEEFVPGQRIAKPESQQKKEGWVHVGCVVAEHHQHGGGQTEE